MAKRRSIFQEMMRDHRRIQAQRGDIINLDDQHNPFVRNPLSPIPEPIDTSFEDYLKQHGPVSVGDISPGSIRADIIDPNKKRDGS